MMINIYNGREKELCLMKHFKHKAKVRIGNLSLHEANEKEVINPFEYRLFKLVKVNKKF